LSAVSLVPAGVFPFFDAIDPSGKFAYVGDVVSNDVLTYDVNTNGRLDLDRNRRGGQLSVPGRG